MRRACLPLLLFIGAITAPYLHAEEASPAVGAAEKTLVWPDGTRYVGGVEDGKRSGKGTIFWQDGTRFVGEFENDMRNGPGTMILPDGTVYTGVFRDDELIEADATTVAAADAPEPAEILSDEEAEGDIAAMFDAPVNAITDTTRAALKQTLSLWAAAWSDQNVAQYLSNYALDFETPGQMRRAEWEALRRTRLSRPTSISVEVEVTRQELVATDVVDVYFSQVYRSNLYRDQTDKVLRLRREGEDWKIIQERSL